MLCADGAFRAMCENAGDGGCMVLVTLLHSAYVVTYCSSRGAPKIFGRNVQILKVSAPKLGYGGAYRRKISA